jgi:hypothetical protein
MGACLPRVMGDVILWALTRMTGGPVVPGEQPRGYEGRCARKNFKKKSQTFVMHHRRPIVKALKKMFSPNRLRHESDLSTTELAYRLDRTNRPQGHWPPKVLIRKEMRTPRIVSHIPLFEHLRRL